MGEDLLTLLDRAAEVLGASTRAALAGLGLGVRDFAVLSRLEHDGPVAQHEVARLLRIDRTTIVHDVNRLERRGLVGRCPDPTDRRRKILRLTAAGRQTVVRASRARARASLAFAAGDEAALRLVLCRLLGPLDVAEPGGRR